MAVPSHWPLLSQVSSIVHALPSWHAAPVLGVTVQLAVPLQVRVLHWSEVQVIAVPAHWPLPSQVSLKVQASASSHRVPVGGGTVERAVALLVLHVYSTAVRPIAGPSHWHTPVLQSW